MVAIPKASFFFGNQDQPKYITNCFYCPDGYLPNNATVPTTATRVYYTPFAVHSSHTFQGVSCFNQSAGDNGELIRMMVFTSIDGAVGTLVKDFGEITLTGASALRTLTSSWAASPGTYWMGHWFNSATDMYGMLPITVATAVGAVHGPTMSHMIGNFTSNLNAGAGTIAAAHYVDTTYGAAPGTAVAPTATLSLTNLSTTALVPAWALKA